jgi:hypothetical protein
MKAGRLLVCVTGLILGAAVFGFSKDVYVAQNAAGTDSGSDCGNAHSAVWFNTSGNWGSGGSQISAGDTVHLCGSFSSALNVQASGTAGNIITVLFESGAKVSLPYCSSNGCIGLGNNAYITVDGGTNGIIENTANGTSLANQQYSNGIFGGSCSSIEIKNLTIRNIYVRTANSTDNGTGATNSSGVFINNAHSNIKVHNNVIPEAHTGVGLWTDTGTFGNWEVYNNTISQNVWGVDLAGGYNSGQLDGASVHDNTIFDNDHWWGPDNNFHTDPIFVRAPNAAGSEYRNVYIYNNYIYGALGHMTGYIFLTQYSNGPTYVFNNILRADSTAAAPYNCAGEGAIAMQWNGTNNYYIYNNTIDGRTACGITTSERSTNSFNGTYLEWKNNITLNLMGHYVQSGTYLSDYNDWYLIANASGQAFNTLGTYYTWTAWQSAGKDPHGITADPLLNSDYTLHATSPAIRLGQNLTSICQGKPVPGLGALCQDKNGASRPATGGWDAGATQYSSQVGAIVPPSGLAAIVH